MSTKKTVQPKKKTGKVSHPPEEHYTYLQKIQKAARGLVRKSKGRTQAFLARRPHRSFRRTRRRDYVRAWKIPGYVAFTIYVQKTLWRQKKLFFWLIVLYLAITIVLIGIGSQDTYNQLSNTLRTTSADVFKGAWGEVGKAGLLVVTGITGGFNSTINAVQQVYIVLIILFTWLTTVWILRAILAGHRPKLRDGLYSAGAPIFSTFLVGLYLVLQLLPVAVAAVGFAALVPYGILDGGVEAMIFWVVALLLTALSFYWITSTLIALVVVTLPGMYPYQAVKTAGDLVIGRRIRILLRFLWLLLVLVVAWAVIMIPIVLFDTWLKGILSTLEWVPLVPVAFAVMMTLTVVWVASYVYLLYRRVVDDDAAPA